MGVLVGKGGFYGNVFRITPPLCFTKEDSGKACFSAEAIPLLIFDPQLYRGNNVEIRAADFFIDVMDIALSKL